MSDGPVSVRIRFSQRYSGTPQMKLLSKNAVVFSCKTSVAAFLALYISLLLNFEKPAWAMTTVLVTSQSFAASTLSKSIFRLMGTLLGGVFILLIWPETVQSPMLLSLVVSLWVTVCLYLSLHDRTPKSYIFMLAGYSAAIMGFPEVTTPTAITGTVISRIEEITLGIVCSTMVHSLIFPVSMGNLLGDSINGWYKNARTLCNELLTVESKHKSPAREDILIQLARYPLDVETLMTHAVYEGDEARKVIRLVSVQYKHLTYLLPTLTAIETRLSLLSELNIQFPSSVTRSFNLFLHWLNAEQGVPGVEIQAELTRSKEELNTAWHLGASSTEETLLMIGLLDRLANFVRIADAYQTVSARASDLYHHDNAPSVKSTRNHRHHDKGLLLLSSLTAFLATFLSCLFWIGTGWASGASAPLMASIISSFFAGIDSPITSMKLFVKGVLIALAVSLFYVAVLIPQATTFEALLMCLFPGLFLLGLIIARASTNLIGLSVAIQIPGFIGFSHHYVPDLGATINAALSTLVGIFVAVVLTALIRNKRPSWIAKRAVRKGVRDLLRFIKEIERESSSLLSRQQFISRMLDRVNIILPRRRLDPEPELMAGGDLIVEAWLGANSYDFYARNLHIIREHRIESQLMFHELGLYLQQKMRSLKAQPQQALLDELNLLLITLERLSKEHQAVMGLLIPLFNIRVSLFPHARWPTEK